MTKVEVVKRLMDKTGLSRNQSIDAVEYFLDSVKSAVKSGEKVCLVGFGTFHVKKKNSRQGRNPRTGEKIRIKEKNVAIFKPGKAFREIVNQKDYS